MAGTKVLMGFALATLTAVTIAGTTITWYEGPISDRQGFIDSQISGLTGEATIGQSGDPNEAEEEFRALVAFNMLAASQCELIELVHFDRQEFEDMVGEEIDDFDASGIPEKGSNIDSLADRGGEEDSFYVWFDGFEPLERTDFHAECYALDIDFDAEEIVADAAEEIPGLGTGVAAARAISDGYSSLFGSNLPYEDTDLSMEGNVGSVDFDVESNFTVNDPRLLGMRLEDAEDGVPRLWRGHRAALFIPGRLDAQEFVSIHRHDSEVGNIGDGYEEASDQRTDMDRDGWGEPLKEHGIPDIYRSNVNFRWDGGLYSVEVQGMDKAEEFFWMERIRMMNIPIITDTQPDLENSEEEYHSSVIMDYFMDNSKYVICDGTSGVLSTEAERVGNTGPTSQDSPVWRDVTFTKVETDRTVQNSDHCIDADIQNPGVDDIYGVTVKRYDPREDSFPILNSDTELTEDKCEMDELIDSDEEGVSLSSETYPLYLSVEDDEYVEMECNLVVRRGMQYFDDALESDEELSWGQDVTFYNLEHTFSEDLPDPQTYDITEMFYIDDESGTGDSDTGESEVMAEYTTNEGFSATAFLEERVIHNVERFQEGKEVELTLGDWEKWTDERSAGDGTVQGYIRFVIPEEDDIVLRIRIDETTEDAIRIWDHTDDEYDREHAFSKDEDITFRLDTSGQDLELSWEGIDHEGVQRSNVETGIPGERVDEIAIRADEGDYKLKSLNLNNAEPRTE